MNQIDIDNKYISSTAYHEAGHTVVAAVQEMPMRNFGVRMDSLGCGKVFYWRRVPDGSRNNVGAEIERERTIISASAGFIAQKRFYGEHLTEDLRMYMELSAGSDTNLVLELLHEMYPANSATWSQARKHLYDESVHLVDWHWLAVEALANALLNKDWAPRQMQTDAEGKWSLDKIEKTLPGTEIVQTLKPFGINAFIVDDSAQSYSPTLKPQGSTARSRNSWSNFGH